MSLLCLLGRKSIKASVCVWGVISDFREVRTRKGVLMAFARLEDGTGTLETVFFSDVYLQFEKRIRSSDETLVLKGTLSKEGNTSPRLLVQDVELVRNRLNNCSRGVILQFNEKEKYKFSMLKRIFSQNTGNVPVYFNVKLDSPAKVVCLKSHSSHGVTLSSQLLEQMQREMGGQDKVQLY